MKFLKKLFGATEKDEVAEVFGKLEKMFRDEQTQNETLNPAIRELLRQNRPCDEIPGAQGEFGRCITNPIPTNGPLGSMAYLTDLFHDRSQSPVMFHRIGSNAGVDMYEVVTFDGSYWDMLFLKMYYPARSRKAPRNFSIISGMKSSSVSAELRTPIFRGVNSMVDPFPHALPDAIRQMLNGFGIPMANPYVRRAVEAGNFVRSSA